MVKKHVFKLGDRVKIIAGSHKGQFGSVARVPEKVSFSGVGIYLDEFDTNNHNCGGRVRTGFGWWVDEADLELAYPKGSLDYILFAPLRDKKK